VYTAEALLRAEGFTDVHYISDLPPDAIARGKLDFDFDAAPSIVSQLASGEPITALAGIHSGCFELFAYEHRTISDLKGKKFGIPMVGSSPHLLLAIMAAHVGLDPEKDINWIVSPTGYSLELFATAPGLPSEPAALAAAEAGNLPLRQSARTR
jgi:NitT/TauT family transport system substrate-binding protein